MDNKATYISQKLVSIKYVGITISELCYLYTQKLTTFGTTILFSLQQKNKVRGGDKE
jgi:hypothetical protein